MNDSLFSEAELIHCVTRADLLADGTLRDVTKLAKEAGFRISVAITQAAWSEAVAVVDDDRKEGQSETGRLWDVLYIAAVRVRQNKALPTHRFSVSVRVGGRPTLVALKLILHPGDSGELVATVLLPNED